jgi:hypothetical protein
MKIQQVKVKNMTSRNNNIVPNQFIIRIKSNSKDQAGFDKVYFQSYNSIIAYKDHRNNITLDKYRWDHSTTTSKYRNQFLNETKKETLQKIKKGIYKLANLNL